MSLIARVLTRVFVDDLESALPLYETLAREPAHRFTFRDVRLARVGPFLLLAGNAEPYRNRTATVEVTDLGGTFSALTGAGAEVLEGPSPGPTGDRLIVRHPDGAVFEYIERRPAPTAEDETARSPWIRTVGDGVPVVLIHGQSIDHRMMLPLDPVIASAGGFQRLYIDLPGHGHSEPVAPMTTDTIVDVVADRLRSFLGTTPFAIIGASFGGAVALGVADLLGEQVLGTALLAPALLPRDLRDLPEPRPDDASTELALPSDVPARDRAAFAAVTARRDRDRWNLFAEYVRPGLADHDARAVDELAAWQATAPARIPQAHGGRHLIVTGRQDAVVGWRDQQVLLDAYPRATYAVLDDCGHNPHLERPRAVSALIADWLESLRS